MHCDLRVRWKVASDLRFRAAISEPKTPSCCGISGDLAQSTRKSLAIAIVRFWCAKFIIVVLVVASFVLVVVVVCLFCLFLSIYPPFFPSCVLVAVFFLNAFRQDFGVVWMFAKNIFSCSYGSPKI